jgi:hypothetical protein
MDCDQADLALTPGEAHDNRLCSVLLSQQRAWANIPPKRNRTDPICFSPCLYRARNLVERFFNSSSNVGVSRPDTTNSQPIIWHSPSSHQSVFGCALMSPRPNSAILDQERQAAGPASDIYDTLAVCNAGEVQKKWRQTLAPSPHVLVVSGSAF